MKSRILGLLAATLMAGPMAANAASITFGFTGAYTGTNGGFANPAYNFSGSTVSGTFTFDTAANCGSSTACLYASAISAVQGTVNWSGGAFAFGATDGDIRVQNNNGGTPRDLFQVLSENTTSTSDGVFDNNLVGYRLNQFVLELRETTDLSCLTSTDLPQTPPAIGCFTKRVIELTFTGDGGTTNTIFFQLAGLREVPEPGTLALLGLGLVGLGLSRRRKAA